MKLLLLLALAALTACCHQPEARQHLMMSKATPRVVQVDVDCPQGGSWGSGVVLRGNQLHSVIATAAHVIDAPADCKITVKNQPVIVVSRDDENDVAIVLTASLGVMAPLVMNTDPYLGMPVTAMGYPRQRLGDTSLMVSRGYLLVEFTNRYRISSHIDFGSSGGPVFDADGHLLGLSVSMHTSWGAPIDGNYYMVPARFIKE